MPQLLFVFTLHNETQAKYIENSNKTVPVIRHGNNIITFEQYLDFSFSKGKEEIDPIHINQVDVEKVLDASYNNEKYPTLADCEYLLKRIFNRCLHLYFKDRGLFWYELSNKSNCYYYPKDLIKNNKSTFSYHNRKKTKNVFGKYFSSYWHFAISYKTKIHPFLQNQGLTLLIQILMKKNIMIMKSMNKFYHIDEPLIHFGYDQPLDDPRDGLTLFGPFSRTNITSARIGIIGTEIGKKMFLEWLNKIESPVKSLDNIARPFFPGIAATYELEINYGAIRQITIDEDNIREYLKLSDSHQRVHRLANLYVDKLINYVQQEEFIVDIWFLIIPDDIYKYCRPKSRIPITPEINTIGIRGKSLRRNESSIEEINELQEAYKYELKFHNQVKGKLLKNRIVTQIIKESTIRFKHFISDETKILSEKKFDSAKAWNIVNSMYYKLGGIPWKLSNVRKNVCYVGLVYKKIETDSNEQTACCAAQMFLDTGDGFVFRGNIGPWYNPVSNEYHLKKESAFNLIDKALKSFQEKNNTTPDEIFIHSKTYFNDDEWEGFEEAVKDKAKIVGVRIRDDRTFKMFRDFRYPILRGTVLELDSNYAYLWTKGFIPRLQTILGLETPNPLSVELIRGQSDINTICKDILSLTKLMLTHVYMVTAYRLRYVLPM